MTTDIRLPPNWMGSAELLSDPAHATYRSAMRCLIGVTDGTELSVSRDSEPTVAVSSGQVTVHDEVTVDLFQPGKANLGLVTLTPLGDVWSIEAWSPQALTSSKWTVEITAPDKWLAQAEPVPWPPATAGDGKLTWELSPNNGLLVSAKLSPDDRSRLTIEDGDRSGRISTIAMSWDQWLPLSLGILVVVWLVRRRARQDRTILTPVTKDVRRVVWPLVVLNVVALLLALSSPILDGLSADIHDWGWVYWAGDILVGLTVVYLAWRWWLPRSVLVAALVAMTALLGGIVWASDRYLFRNTDPRLQHGTQLAEVALLYVVLTIALAALANAIRVLLSRERGLAWRRTLPGWMWLSAAVLAGGLVTEQFLTKSAGVARQDWLVDPGTGEFLGDVYRFTLSDLPVTWRWIFLAVGAVAMLTFAREHVRRSARPSPGSLRLMGLMLFLVGPCYLTCWFANIDIPTWPFLVIALWLMLKGSAPVLARRTGGRTVQSYVDSEGVTGVGLAAADWIRKHAKPARRGAQPARRITPVDVVLALGPGETPFGNMNRMFRLVVVPAVLCGGASLVMGWVNYVGFQDSYIFKFGTDVLFTAMTWTFAAALTGLLWQRLPGLRGPIKVLPVVFAYVLGPAVCQLVAAISGTYYAFDGLIGAGFFAAGMVVTGVRMDIAVLRNLNTSRLVPFRDVVAVYGLGNLPSKVTVGLAPVTAIVALVSTLLAGPTHEPNTERTDRPAAGSAVGDRLAGP